MKCSFCGYTFSTEKAETGCQSCPMTTLCQKIKCPNCGYEMPAEPKLPKFLKSWLKGD